MIEVTGIKLDPKWKWMAKDLDGAWYLYTMTPDKRTTDWYSETANSTTMHRVFVLPDVPWQDSLHEVIHTENGFRFEKPRPDFVVDEPVMVRNFSYPSVWERRHFAKWGVRGEILTWDKGVTSFTVTSRGFVSKWDEYRLPTPEELKGNAHNK